MPKMLKRDNLPDLAYIKYEGPSDLPTVMFLGGFKSDMMGSKASFLEDHCKARGQSYIRFDYSGHGQSKGEFVKGCINDWLKDAADILESCTSRKVILIGSSMGGWISLLLALQKPERVHALIGIAAAPDFTTWMERDMDDAQRVILDKEGQFELPSDYDEPYIITKKLLNDGRKHVLLNGKVEIDIPVRLLQGRKDKSVPWEVAERIKEAIITDNVIIHYQEGGDHSLSSPQDLELLSSVLNTLS